MFKRFRKSLQKKKSAYQSSKCPNFRETAEQWIQEQGEVLILIRFSAASGCTSWEMYNTYAFFRDRIDNLPPQTCIIVFREHDLTKGIVDESFIKKVVNRHPEGEWWLVACLELITMGSASWYHHNVYDTSEEIEEELRDEEFCFGKYVAVGKELEWLDERDGLISAVVPFADGTVETGVY